MGYDVHITRRRNWTDRGEPSVSFDEWSALVDRDSEMRRVGVAEASVDGATLRVERPGLSAWTANPDNKHNDSQAWFDWRDGEIVVKNPDVKMLRKVYAIAQILAAQVQGDDGEVYDADGNCTNRSSRSIVAPVTKPWWKPW